MIDGKNYFCPAVLVPAFKDSKASAVASEVVTAISGESRLLSLVSGMFTSRATGRMALRADFSQTNAMTGILARKLKALRDSQQAFWMECDSVMSRDFAVLHPADDSALRWATPTYPITPKACDPGDAVDWTGAVYVNGKIKASGWSIDAAEGLLTFDEDEAITLSSRVCLLYRWRMMAIVAAATFTDLEVGENLGGTRLLYGGSILFEQWFGTAPTWVAPTDADEFDVEDVTE